jgi:hypothetical protein
MLECSMLECVIVKSTYLPNLRGNLGSMAAALATSHVCLSGQVVPLLHKPANRRQCTRKTRALHNESSSSRSNPARKASVQEESHSATAEKPLQSQEKARFLQLEEDTPRERALKGRAPHVSKDERKLLGRRRLLSKGLLAAVCCPLCSQLQTASAAEWSYGGPSGPTGWGGFCAFGRQQSPVDVPVKGSQLKMDALGKLHFNYSAADVTVVNTGHGTMQVSCTGLCVSHSLVHLLLLKASYSAERSATGMLHSVHSGQLREQCIRASLLPEG